MEAELAALDHQERQAGTEAAVLQAQQAAAAAEDAAAAPPQPPTPHSPPAPTRSCEVAILLAAGPGRRHCLRHAAGLWFHVHALLHAGPHVCVITENTCASLESENGTDDVPGPRLQISPCF